MSVAVLDRSVRCGIVAEPDSRYPGVKWTIKSRPAVSGVIQRNDTVGGHRLPVRGFIALRSRYRFDSPFCRRDKDGAHEKGGVTVRSGKHVTFLAHWPAN